MNRYLILLSLVLLSVTGCDVTRDRLANVGKAPAFTDVQSPNERPSYKPIKWPDEEEPQGVRQVNSLWQPGSRTFFRDPRARRWFVQTGGGTGGRRTRPAAGRRRWAEPVTGQGQGHGNLRAARTKIEQLRGSAKPAQPAAGRHWQNPAECPMCATMGPQGPTQGEWHGENHLYRT